MHIGIPAANITINTFALFYGYATSTRNAYELERGRRAFAITRGGLQRQCGRPSGVKLQC